MLNSYLSGRAVNDSGAHARIIGAPGELGATKTHDFPDGDAPWCCVRFGRERPEYRP